MTPGEALFQYARSFAFKKAAAMKLGDVPDLPAAPAVTLGGEGAAWRAGFALRDISPKITKMHPYWMAGYRIGKSITGVLDPVTASALWLDCGGDGVVLLSLDLIGLTGYDVNELRNALEPFCRRTGCRNVTFSCTHTHAGPDTMGYWGPLPKSGKDKAYMRFLKDTVLLLCEDAYRDRRPGQLYYGSADAPELNHRWRKPDYKKSVLHRFRFVPDGGGKEAWYLNFPAHPNTLGGRNRLLSADYPCYMRREIQRNKDVNVLFSVSAIGATDIGEVAKDDLERTVLGGMLLGKRALEIQNDRPLPAELTFVRQPFVMPLDNPVLSLANTLHIFTARRCAAESDTKTGFISELTYFSFGGVQVLTVPGEMFPELVWAGGYQDAGHSATGEGADVDPTPLSEIFDDDDLIIFGVTNDMAGYAMARNDFILDDKMPFLNRATDRFGRSHYHETNSCGISTGDVIAATAKRIRQTLAAGGKL